LSKDKEALKAQMLGILKKKPKNETENKPERDQTGF